MTEANTALKPGWKVWCFDQMATNVNVRIDNPSESGMEHYVGLEHLDADSLKIRRWGTPDDVEATKLMFKKGDIIFGRRRAYQRKLGVAEFDGICSAHAMVVRAKPDVVLPEFLPFFMQGDLFMDRAVEISVGSLSPTINWKTMAVQEFALPPIAEQQRAVEMLNAARGAKDEATNLVDSIEQLRESLALNSWNAGSGLEEHPLGELCEKIQDGTHFSPQSTNGEFRYITSKNIRNGYLDISDCGWISKSEHEDIFRRCDVRKGDVLLTKDGANTGNVAINTLDEPFSLLSSVALLRPTKTLHARYLYEFLRSSIGRRKIVSQMSGTAITRVTLRQIKAISISMIDLEKQMALVAQFAEIGNALSSAQARLAAADAMYHHAITQVSAGV